MQDDAEVVRGVAECCGLAGEVEDGGHAERGESEERVHTRRDDGDEGNRGVGRSQSGATN